MWFGAGRIKAKKTDGQTRKQQKHPSRDSSSKSFDLDTNTLTIRPHRILVHGILSIIVVQIAVKWPDLADLDFLIVGFRGRYFNFTVQTPRVQTSPKVKPPVHKAEQI